MSIVITGNPGVGKHTVAKLLAKKLGFRLVDVNKVAISNKIYKKNKSTLEVDTARLSKIISKLITPETVVVGHLAPYVVSKSGADTVIILRKNPYRLIPIYKKRKYSQKKMYENLGSEILGVIAYDTFTKFGKKAIQIDATGICAKKLLKKILASMKTKKQDKVDWLGMVAKKNQLSRFFR